MSDYTDLHDANEKYQSKARILDDKLKKEMDAKLKLGEKQLIARKKYFPQLASKELSHALFREYLKDETFEEEIDVEKASTERKIVENQVEATKESLNVIKKLIDK